MISCIPWSPTTIQSKSIRIHFSPLKCKSRLQKPCNPIKIPLKSIKIHQFPLNSMKIHSNPAKNVVKLTVPGFHCVTTTCALESCQRPRSARPVMRWRFFGTCSRRKNWEMPKGAERFATNYVTYCDILWHYDLWILWRYIMMLN